MRIVIIAAADQKEEILSGSIMTASIEWLSHHTEVASSPSADAYIDLLFDNEPHRIQLLQSLLPAPIIINSVAHTLAQTDNRFIRINGWPSFLKSKLTEAAAVPALQPSADAVWQALDRHFVWLPDEPGFVTPRVISMMINEAYLAKNDSVSTETQIDTAMKLGTAYPHGPFEWASLIGVEKVHALLNAMGVDKCGLH